MFSLDAALGLGVLWTSGLTLLLLGLGILGGFVNLAARRPAPPADSVQTA
jgi:hypothetical protein